MHIEPYQTRANGPRNPGNRYPDEGWDLRRAVGTGLRRYDKKGSVSNKLPVRRKRNPTRAQAPSTVIGTERRLTAAPISISLVAVFIPLFLMSGIVGLLFREFAVIVAVSIVVSVIVSLTLTPKMCARTLTAEGKTRPSLISRVLERFFDGLAAVYDRALVVALRHRFVTLMVKISTVGLTGVLFIEIPKGFFPQQDTGLIVGIAEGAQNISPQAMKDRMQAVLAVVTKHPAVAAANAYIGPGGPTVTENDGRMFITLKPLGERTASADQVIASLNKALQPVWGTTLYMRRRQTSQSARGSPRPNTNILWSMSTATSSITGRRSS